MWTFLLLPDFFSGPPSSPPEPPEGSLTPEVGNCYFLMCSKATLTLFITLILKFRAAYFSFVHLLSYLTVVFLFDPLITWMILQVQHTVCVCVCELFGSLKKMQTDKNVAFSSTIIPSDTFLCHSGRKWAQATTLPPPSGPVVSSSVRTLNENLTLVMGEIRVSDLLMFLLSSFFFFFTIFPLVLICLMCKNCILCESAGAAIWARSPWKKVSVGPSWKNKG